MHHRDDVADFLDEAHVVLDDDEGVAALEAIEELGGPVVSCAVMPAVGSSIRMSSLFCASSRAISSHCVWPCER